ncbi:hypothetical protein HYFRA_00008289 [Hymenoscyphus fraxineus]|uniref:Uncharacterized protein n=1 Tax=Hymenoscyphus fraxineus TaxID=746836 RepID=A0A9N9KQ78_9HELO|nr:hypothetical protein HYFRA_00008289 [Hymenoscyphus fraxineus]
MPNLSLFAIPAYWLLSMLPNLYAIHLAARSNNGVWDNTSPRSAEWEERVRKSTTSEQYNTYIRSRAAHKNGFETLPLFIGAILAGNAAKLGPEYMNMFVGVNLVLRVVYTIVYVRTTKNSSSYFRTVVWFAECYYCLWVFTKSGLVLMEE